MTDTPAPTTPKTDAGKALVEWAENAYPNQVHIWREHAALIEAEARSTSSEPLDVPRLVQALRHLGFHEMDADEGRYLHPESAGSAIAAEYARLSRNEEPTDA